MSREIKFRAWRNPYSDDDNGEMIYSMLGEEKRFLSFGFYADSGWELEEFTLMRYSGLKDKNDREIYEGDIVTYGRLSRSLIGVQNYEVVYCDGIGYASFGLKGLNGDHKDLTFPHPIQGVIKVPTGGRINLETGERELTQYKDEHSGIEVLGNKYENPDLVE